VPAPIHSHKGPAPVLQLNDLAFVHVRSKAADRPATFSGLYDVRSGGVLLFEPDGTPFALACANGDHGRWRGPGFFVTAREYEGKIWYAFSTTEQTERRLGIHGQSHSQQTRAARALIDQARPIARRWNPEPVAEA